MQPLGITGESPSRSRHRHLSALDRTPARFGVVPYHSIVAAFTDGEVRRLERKANPLPTPAEGSCYRRPSSGNGGVSYRERQDMAA